MEFFEELRLRSYCSGPAQCPLHIRLCLLEGLNGISGDKDSRSMRLGVRLRLWMWQESGHGEGRASWTCCYAAWKHHIADNLLAVRQYAGTVLSALPDSEAQPREAWESACVAANACSWLLHVENDVSWFFIIPDAQCMVNLPTFTSQNYLVFLR